MSKTKTDRLFDKAALFSDIHLGLKHNSKTHNQDCVDFVTWFCEESKSKGAETCIFLGDWHHHRNTINVSTLDYTHKCFEMLNESFKQVYLIVGNHDLYYREKRDINSLPMGDLFENITLVNELTVFDDVVIVPWLVGDEWKKVKNMKCKYMFGHFELPGFKLNAMVEMPDHGGLNKTHFKKQDYVFSGHFHKRQIWQNVHYIGNPFGHNYADAWDFERGAVFLEWDQEPEYVDWEDGPRYMTTSLSQIANEPESFLVPKAHIKAIIDVDLSYEEVNFMKETFVEEFDIRDLKLVPTASSEHSDDTDLDISFESVDEIVVSQISSIESEEFDINELIKIYSNL